MINSILIQARMTSTRLPGKMLKEVGGIPLIEFVYKRCQCSQLADSVVVVTSEDGSDDPIADFCQKKKMLLHRGPLDDVLKRYVKAARFYNADLVCRICGDSPFVDIENIDRLFRKLSTNNYQYGFITNVLRGFISEVATLEALEHLDSLDLKHDEREHVTTFIRNNPGNYKTISLDAGLCPPELSHISLTVDYQKDLDLANKIVSTGLELFNFTSRSILNILQRIEP